MRYFLYVDHLCFFVLCCYAVASVHCCLVVTLGERADLLALGCDVYCDYVTFPFGILGQVCYFIVSILDHCCLSYFKLNSYDTLNSKGVRHIHWLSTISLHSMHPFLLSNQGKYY